MMLSYLYSLLLPVTDRKGLPIVTSCCGIAIIFDHSRKQHGGYILHARKFDGFSKYMKELGACVTVCHGGKYI